MDSSLNDLDLDLLYTMYPSQSHSSLSSLPFTTSSHSVRRDERRDDGSSGLLSIVFVKFHLKRKPCNFILSYKIASSCLRIKFPSILFAAMMKQFLICNIVTNLEISLQYGHYVTTSSPAPALCLSVSSRTSNVKVLALADGK